MKLEKDITNDDDDRLSRYLDKRLTDGGKVVSHTRSAGRPLHKDSFS
jgi:hypothetical protein